MPMPKRKHTTPLTGRRTIMTNRAKMSHGDSASPTRISETFPGLVGVLIMSSMMVVFLGCPGLFMVVTAFTPAMTSTATAGTLSTNVSPLSHHPHHHGSLPFVLQSSSTRTTRSTASATSLDMSSFIGDSSEYGSSDSDYDDDDDDYGTSSYNPYRDESSMADAPVQELQPVPMSKNSGNRFVALYFDHEVVSKDDDRSPLDLHYDRNGQTNEDHVLFCRKRNLYNETFNTDSMVDILRSLPILSSDLQRIIGHAMIMESTDIKYVHELLREDPVLKAITRGDEDAYRNRVPLYRWRHIRDHTLRHDDGRFGYPCMMIGLDDDPEVIGNLRAETERETLRYLMMSDKVIAAGPLHLPTQLKDDPSSIAVGDLIMFNAKDRHDAIEFVENMPSSFNGLYKDMRVHFYNQLDVTGKFVSEDPLRDAPGGQMKEAMEVWGYPVDDDQTPWLNW